MCSIRVVPDVCARETPGRNCGSLERRSRWRAGRVTQALGLAGALAVLLISCTQPPPDPDDDQDPNNPPSGSPITQPSFEVQVDPSIAVQGRTLETYPDGVPRPVGVVTDDSGIPLEMVENELMIVTNDPLALGAFAERWNGTILATFDPAAYGADGDQVHLVRIDTSRADRARLSQDLAALNPSGGDRIRVSSDTAANLIAAGAAEAASGLQVGLNFLPKSTGLQDRTLTEGSTASVALTARDRTYSEPWNANPFNWSYMRVGGPQNFGVAEAWRVLERAGRLNNKVKIAIIDGGFADSSDYPPEREHNNATINALDPTEANQVECTGGSACPWHGINVTDTCMARVDNSYGAAGPAGPVARALTIRRSNDIFNNLHAIGAAVFSGAKIINMSFGGRVPASLSWAVLPFSGATGWAYSQGKLIFASAGNDNENVDHEHCFIACWEAAWITPCENSGVICVGALDANSRFRRSDSNYGPEELDIWGPGAVWVGPDYADFNVHMFGATSAASPFVAGVAALIWAANPGLSNADVERILYDTANQGAGTGESRWPNAYAAVVQALGGNAPPELSNVKVERQGFVGNTVSLTCDASDPEDGTVDVIWRSNLAGEIGRGTQVPVVLSYGTHVITCTAVDKGGMSVSQTVVFTMTNNPPRLVLDQPAPATSYFAGQTAFFQVYSYDIEEGATLPDARVRWTSNLQGDLGTGNFLQRALTTVGTHVITVTGTDRDGLTSSVNETVVVNPPPPDGLPPTAFILTMDFDPYASSPVISLVGIATDPEDGPLTGLSVAWTISGQATWNIPGGTAFGNSISAVLSAQANPAPFTITLTVTDSTGKTATHSRNGQLSPLR